MATSPPCNHKTSAIEEGKVAMDIDEAITTPTEPAEERRFPHELENEALGDQAGLFSIDEKYIKDPFIFDIAKENLKTHYYATKIWEPTWYAQLSYRGFVSVSLEHEEGNYLLPELQRHYSTMWLNKLPLDDGVLHIPKKARKRAKKFVLCVDKEFTNVWKGIQDLHKDKNWVIEDYQNLFEKLKKVDEEEDGISIGLDETRARFRPVSVKLLNLKGEIAGGEFGYTIGSTYTSLSGFSKREKKFNGAGIVQLCALGRLLEKKGYRVWNMGHPFRAGKTESEASMMYKKTVGAVVVTRAEFLKAWNDARDIDEVKRLWGNYPCKTLLQKIT